MNNMSRSNRRHSINHDLLDMLKHNWHLGITSFGGPAVHFQIVRRKIITLKSMHVEWNDKRGKFVVPPPLRREI